MDKKTILWKLLCTAAVVALAVLLLCGVFNGKDSKYHLQDRSAIGPLTGKDVTKLTLEAPTETAYDGTIQAEDWKALFPEIALSMMDNDKNTEIVDYLEQDPYLVNLYEGYGFALEYGSARGHAYTLVDVSGEKLSTEVGLDEKAGTARPHPFANCLTCKTPNFAKLVQDKGVEVYGYDFNEVADQIKQQGEAISCYTCHGNDAGSEGTLRITHNYVNEALSGDALKQIDPATLSCGQCHIEYYFTVENKETMMPYSDVDSMSPEEILAYYDNMQIDRDVTLKDISTQDTYTVTAGTEGFSDWYQASTGARLLKAQHPEMETFLQGKHAAMGMNCADCHMEVRMNEDGTVYHSHELVSPLDSDAILSTCAECHQGENVVQKVRRIQDSVTAKETQVGNSLSAFKDALAEANAAKAMTEEELEAVRKLYREAQWFFDFCYVENAEGAHNSELAFRCLDTAQARINDGMALLKGKTTENPED